MIDFLERVFVFLVFGTPIVAIVALLAGLLAKNLRGGLLPAIGSALIGYLVGVGLGGGFGQTDGWGWGNVGAALLGMEYAAAGFLIGFGGSCLISKRDQTIGLFLICVGLAFPLAHAGRMVLRPALVKSEMDWWRPILVNGYTENTEDSARAHFSPPTEQALNEYVYRCGTGDIKTKIPPSTLEVLYSLGVPVSGYVPLPADLAERINARNPSDRLLARNPSTPEAIQRTLSQSPEWDLLLELSRNANLDAAIADDLKRRFESTISEESKKADPNDYKINISKEGLASLAKKHSRERP